MHLKTAKNKRVIAWLLLVCLLVPFFCVPQQALAYNFYVPTLIDNSNGIVCPNTSPGAPSENYGLMSRVVPCIKESIVYATNYLMFPVMQLVAGAVSAACVLAIFIWGVAMATGKQGAPTASAATLALKLVFVAVFAFDFGFSTLGTNTFGLMLDMVDNMLGIAGSYITDYSALANNLDCPNISGVTSAMRVWETMDCAIETLVGGIYSSISLKYGIVGFLFASMFAGSVGVIIALAGAYVVMQLIRAIAHCLYIFMSSYMSIALLVIVSPLFIPCILFSGTKGYFDRWLHQLIRNMLVPIVLFAWASVLMAALDAVLFAGPNSVYRAIAGDSIVDTSCLSTGIAQSGSSQNPCGFTVGEWLKYVQAYKKGDALVKGVRVSEVVMKKKEQQLGQQPTDTGINGEVNAIVNTQLVQWLDGMRDGALESLGLGGMLNARTGAPAEVAVEKNNEQIWMVDYAWLAYMSGSISASDYMNYLQTGSSTGVTNYIGRIVLSLFMAAVTVYIFVVLLEQIPFIAGAENTSTMSSLRSLSKLGGGGAGGDIIATVRQKIASGAVK